MLNLSVRSAILQVNGQTPRTGEVTIFVAPMSNSSAVSENRKIPAQPSKLDQVNPFRVMTVMHRAAELEAEGRHIIHMEVGEPDFITAKPIIDAAKAALDAGHTQYTSAPGIPRLRSRVAEHYKHLYGVDIDPGRVLITPGASAGLMLLAHLLIAAEDEILLADPAYPCVRNFIHLANGNPKLLPVTVNDNYQPTLAALKGAITEKTRGVWLASPSNPTGTILSRKRLSSICDWAAAENLHVLVDEIYHGLHYVEDLPSVLEFSQQAFVVNSFSKYFGMTGWRLGWIVVPQAYIEKANILAQNLYISAPSVAQYAALAAFDNETRSIFEQRRAAFRERRDYLSAELSQMGFGLPELIEGAFYIYADISKFSDDAEAFCSAMLEQQGVALTPGTDFGVHESKRFVRFAFTTSMENLVEGVARLRKVLVS